MNRKRNRTLGLSLVVAGLLATSLTGCPFCLGNVVFFPDPELESVVRAEIGEPLGCITEAKLLGLTELQARGFGIQDISGLRFCSNALDINLADNSITSISDLANLVNLTHVNLANNDISSISALAGLPFLKVLNLDGNVNIDDWTPLQANVENGGFPEGGVVVVAQEAVEFEDGSFSASFTAAADALTEAGVEVQIAGLNQTPTNNDGAN